jgi:hypothetical protein
VARWYDRSGEHLGSKAIVMDCTAAVSLQDEMAQASDPGLLADLFVDTFAAIHQTPLGRLPARMPRPPDGPAYLHGVLAGYDQMASKYRSGRRWSSTGSSRTSATCARTLGTTRRSRSSRTCTGPTRTGSWAATGPPPV